MLPVYCLSDHQPEIAALFSDHFFELQVISPECRSTGKQAEKERFLAALQLAEEQHSSLPCLVLKDNLICVLSSAALARKLKPALQLLDWDLLFLNSWLDRCDLYEPTELANVVRSRSSHGVSAIIFSPTGRCTLLGRQKQGKLDMKSPLDTTLSRAIESEQMQALVFVPNLLDYRVQDSKQMSDLAKLTKCRRPPRPDTGLPIEWPIIVAVLSALALVLYFRCIKTEEQCASPEKASPRHRRK